MESLNEVSLYEAQLHQQQFEDILHQFNILSEWVEKNFSDVEFSVEFNDDTGNPVNPAFRIKSRLFTGVHMTPEDRLLKKHEIPISREVFDDPILMAKFIKSIVPSFQQSITKEVNAYYARNKRLALQQSLQ